MCRQPGLAGLGQWSSRVQLDGHGIWHALSSQQDRLFRALTGATALTTVPQCSKTRHSCREIAMQADAELLVLSQDCVQQ